MNEKIEDLRVEIDKIDEKLALLISKRFYLAQKIGEEKRKENIAVLDENREREVFHNFVACFDDDKKEHAKAVLEAIVSASKNLQK